MFKLLDIWINTIKFHFSVVLKGQTNFDLFYMVIAKTYLYTDKDKCIYIPVGNKRNVALFILYNIYVGRYIWSY